jgi:putative NIF3 family GTP cyclohydrolase 1 type 2
MTRRTQSLNISGNFRRAYRLTQIITAFMKFWILYFSFLLAFQNPVNAQSKEPPFTVNEIIDKIKQNVKPQWVTTKTDTIVIGNAFDTVTGIATCMFADMNILKRAVAAHCNLIITHEPIFYNATNTIADFMKTDMVLKEKVAYIKERKLTIFWFHDNAHRNDPDQILQGLADELKWKIISTSPWILEVKKETLTSLANDLKRHFNVEGIRVIGNPNLEVSRVGLVPGLAPTLQMHIGVLQRNDVDVILVGEAREWEDYVYTEDAVLQGKRKAAIFIGHLQSEEPGAKYCADWLKTFVNGTNIVFLKNDNYWWSPK